MRYAPEDPELYRAAAGVLMERGHVKQELEDREGRVCLAGAVNLVQTGNAFGTHRWNETDIIISRALRLRGGDYPSIFWNNRPSTTSSDVTEGLLRVAKWLEEQQATVAPPAPPRPKPQPSGPLRPPPGDDPGAPPDTEER